jgi:hypothetical protein
MVAQAERLRASDFLADIAGWRQATPLNSASFVIGVTPATKEVTLTSRLDGLLLNDTVGLASIFGLQGAPFVLLKLRLESLPDLRPGDEVLLVGIDRLRGETRSMFASVGFVIPSTKHVLLVMQGATDAFTFRPEDISASVLFVRGSSLALIQRQDLYVKWLAVGEPDPMPRPCAGAEVTDDPCAQA